MKNILAVSIFLLVKLVPFTSFAQKKITILGSSTAAGTGASVPDSSWVGKLRAAFNKNAADGIDTIVNNRAVGGYVTYKSLPTGYTVPPDRPTPDPSANVTYVLNDLPIADIVIINYPTNDIVNGYNPKEMMDNLRLMYQQFNQNSIRCYITTTQPRNTASDAQRTVLRQLVDSIQLNFANYAINFWDDLVTNDGLNTIRPEVNSGDGTHVNDLGHRLLFQRVLTKNIFSADAPLPLILSNWQVRLEDKVVKLNWSTAHEEANTSFEIQKSMNGKDFQTVYQRNGAGQNTDYIWIDASPLNGRSFYRLKITEPVKISYSRTIPIINDKKQFITSFYADASQLHVQLSNGRSQSGIFTIINYSGMIIKKQTFRLRSPATTVTIPISELPTGEYFLRITTSDGLTGTERFNRIK